MLRTIVRALPVFLLWHIPAYAQTWSPVGSGAASSVYALEAFDGALFTAGLFTEIGGVNANYIARWNGSAWSSMGSLINFMAADGLYANDTALFIGDGGRVRWWNGGPIQNLTGINSSSFNSSAYSMAHFRDTLYVGGFFSSPFARIARWNGSGYESLTSGCNAQVSSLREFEDRLFACGNFTLAGDSLVNRTAQWDGTAWHTMGTGVNDDVFTQCVFRDTLYIGGRFTLANGLTASRVAKWNGTQWVRVGGTLNDYVTAMAVYRDELYIGGAFTSPSHIAKLAGSTWVPVGGGCNDNVRTMELYHDSLFVGGSFTTAGGLPASRIAKWHTPAAPQAAFSVEVPVLCMDGCTGFIDASTNSPTTYAWEFPGGQPATSDVPTPFVCYPNLGTYPVTLTVTNAAGSSTTLLEEAVVIEVCTGIYGADGPSQVILQPNPATAQVRVFRSAATGPATIRISDMMGREVLRRMTQDAYVVLDVHQLPHGNYIVTVEEADQRHHQRLVVE